MYKYIKWHEILLIFYNLYHFHQSKNGSSPGLSAGLWVSDSGYDEKFDVSFGALYSDIFDIILDYWFIGNRNLFL